MTEPMTPEQLAGIRRWYSGLDDRIDDESLNVIGDLLAEVEWLMAERDAAIQRAEAAERELAKIRDYLAQERKRLLLASLRGEEDADYE